MWSRSNAYQDVVSRAGASRWVSAELGPGEKAPNDAVQPPRWASVQPADLPLTGANCPNCRETFGPPAAREKCVRVVGCGGSPPRTILHGNSLLTGKITGNFAGTFRPNGAESLETLALAGSDRDFSRHGTGN